jgi:NAD(P)-dependent dehydrogenase (short-subunit alcohol dehydrogenase family)
VGVADLDGAGAALVAEEIGGISVQADVRVAADVAELIEVAEREAGPIDVFCSNAGVFVAGGIDTPDEVWEKMWEVNLLSHVYVARHLAPLMAARGGGSLVITASAAGLLAQIGSVTYSVTKHAAVALAEWLAIHHAREGLRVSVLCPQAVRTAMTEGHEGSVASVDGMLEPEAVADSVLAALEEDRFLILPHPEVAEYMKRRATDPERWLRGMGRLRDLYEGGRTE